MATKSGWFKVLKEGKEQILYEKPKKTDPPTQTPAERREGPGGPERHG